MCKIWIFVILNRKRAHQAETSRIELEQNQLAEERDEEDTFEEDAGSAELLFPGIPSIADKTEFSSGCICFVLIEKFVDIASQQLLKYRYLTCIFLGTD